MIIVISGPQGSGKGTQAKLLAKKYDLLPLSMGDLLREEAKTNKEVDELINKKGVLVPDEITLEILKIFLKTRQVKDNFVLDGFPRTVKQYDLLKDWLNENDKKIDVAILLEIGKKETMRRLSGRRMDVKTGKIYNLETAPKPGPGVDLKSLVQRKDDRPEAIFKRLEEYDKNTKPLLDLFRRDGVLVSINGEQSIEAIHQEIVDVVKERFGKI